MASLVHTPSSIPLYNRETPTNYLDCADNKVVFCTGGAGSICSAQVRALVHLGANACIIGRNVSKTENMAKDIATARPGSKVLGLGAVDVRKPEALVAAAERCVKELGSIDFVM
jgi:peroxisomal 2,4-dienoyl-CoA reductase